MPPTSSLRPPVPGSLLPGMNLGEHMGQLWACLLGAQSGLRLRCPPPGESDANNHTASALGGKNPRCQCACLISWGRVILLQGWAPECELCLACLLVTVTKETQGDWSPTLDSLARTSRRGGQAAACKQSPVPGPLSSPACTRTSRSHLRCPHSTPPVSAHFDLHPLPPGPHGPSSPRPLCPEGP